MENKTITKDNVEETENHSESPKIKKKKQLKKSLFF